MNYKKVSVGFLIALCLMAGVGLYGEYNTAYSQNEGGEASPVPEQNESYKKVVFVTPEKSNRKDPYVFNVGLEPLEKASLYARANGYVEKQLVDIGMSVKKGDVLAKLSSPELEQQVLQARQDIIRQKAELKLAEKLYERSKELKKSGAISVNEIDQREAEKDVAVATLSNLQSKLTELEKQYAYTEIKAPFDGMITQRHVNRGDRITASDSVPMYQLVQSDTLRVVVKLPQTLLSAVDLGADGQLVVSEQGENKIPVQFQRQSGAIDETSGTLRVEYELDNKTLKLPSGLTGKIYIQPTAHKTVLKVPSNAVKLVDGSYVVMTIDEHSQVQIKPVTVGTYSNNSVLVQSGLIEQDRVILNPNALLQQGDTVTF